MTGLQLAQVTQSLSQFGLNTTPHGQNSPTTTPQSFPFLSQQPPTPQQDCVLNILAGGYSKHPSQGRNDHNQGNNGQNLPQHSIDEILSLYNWKRSQLHHYTSSSSTKSISTLGDGVERERLTGLLAAGGDCVYSNNTLSLAHPTTNHLLLSATQSHTTPQQGGIGFDYIGVDLGVERWGFSDYLDWNTITIHCSCGQSHRLAVLDDNLALSYNDWQRQYADLRQAEAGNGIGAVGWGQMGNSTNMGQNWSNLGNFGSNVKSRRAQIKSYLKSLLTRPQLPTIIVKDGIEFRAEGGYGGKAQPTSLSSQSPLRQHQQLKPNKQNFFSRAEINSITTSYKRAKEWNRGYQRFYRQLVSRNQTTTGGVNNNNNNNSTPKPSSRPSSKSQSPHKSRPTTPTPANGRFHTFQDALRHQSKKNGGRPVLFWHQQTPYTIQKIKSTLFGPTLPPSSPPSPSSHTNHRSLINPHMVHTLSRHEAVCPITNIVTVANRHQNPNILWYNGDQMSPSHHAVIRTTIIMVQTSPKPNHPPVISTPTIINSLKPPNRKRLWINRWTN